ncbi:polysaccharide pyruvyl transferase family protein, partial [bacterium]|nr:polysaccharide pyruvyl transferase family protein [bacterium]
MKIGVITTQYSPNFGALLQTFALQKFLQHVKNVESVEVIDYYPEHARFFWRVYSHKKDFKHILQNIFVFFHRKNLRAKKKQFELFKEFVKENIRCSQRYSADTIEKTKDCYDAFICGSDQIWNMTRHDDPIWFLYFTKGWKGKMKFAYAPSIADEIPVQCYEHLKKYMDNLDLISVRESSDVNQLQKITKHKIFHACDPIFLLNSNDWDAFIPESKINKPYILCYFISVGDYAVSVVKKIKKLTGMDVLYLNVNARDRFDSKWDVRNCTPFEFISY